jgi:hypothetical protein
MRRVLALSLVVAIAGASAATLQRASAEPAGSRVIDQTMVCSIGKRAGLRQVEIHARTGTRHIEDRTKWKFLASASVTDKSSYPSLGWLAAGGPSYVEPGQKPSNVTLSTAARCKRTSARVPLSAKGLSGFPASPLDDEYHCPVSPRVLVRTRASFRAATSLRPNRRWGTLEARGLVREGVLAVRTETGRPVGLATVNESGKARLYVAHSCKPDLIQSDG